MKLYSVLSAAFIGYLSLFASVVQGRQFRGVQPSDDLLPDSTSTDDNVALFMDSPSSQFPVFDASTPLPSLLTVIREHGLL